MVFGQLADLAGTSLLTVSNVVDTDQLSQKLHADYPFLKEKKFLIAVNQKIITGITELDERSQVALLPPFSGG